MLGSVSNRISLRSCRLRCCVFRLSFKMSKKTTLTLSDKIKLIELKQHENFSVKELMVKFKCGKTQVYDAIKNKDKLMEQWVSCTNSGKSKRVVSVGYEQVERDLYRWFINCRSKSLPISRPIIQTEATKLAEKLGISDFKASNGWLDRFKRRHNIVCKQINGEANDVNQDTVENWKRKLLVLIKGYEAKDIYNADETGLFLRGIPTKSLVIKGDACVGGKKSKDRLTVLMCGSMAGEIRKPLVIGKSMKPRCFKNMNIASLPVTWKSNKKAWMTAEIMEQWLQYFNADMRSQNRNILLFLDNATCHPYIELSNVKIHMLPPNTTSVSQPMDQGVIYTFKSYYRKFMLQSLVCKIDSSTSVHQLATSITVLDAVNWISLSCNSLKNECVQNCFRKAGFLIDGSDVNPNENALTEIQDIFAALDFDQEQFLHIDDQLETQQTHDSAISMVENESEKDEDNDENQYEEPENMVKDYKTAICYLEELQKFSLTVSNSELLDLISRAKECVERDVLQNKKQKSITDFFQKI